MNSNTLLELSVAQLKQAVAIKEKIDALQDELAAILGGDDVPARRGRPPGLKAIDSIGEVKQRRTMSPAARAKIAEAAKKRWAKVRAEKAK